MNMKFRLLSVLVVVAVLIAALPAQQAKAEITTLYVDAADDCGGNSPCYAHPQDAVNAANPGDTILVYPGTYDSRYSQCPWANCGGSDLYAPALIVYKDGLTIRAVDPDPAKTVIQSNHKFWSNAGPVERSTANGIVGIGGWSPNAAVIVANNVTIEGFTFHRPNYCTTSPNDCFNNTAGVFIGSKGAGYSDFLGQANGAVVKNNAFSNVWHAVYIWHSRDNQILNNIVEALGNTGHWAGISVYDGGSETQINYGSLSENNLIAGNVLADKGIAIGAWMPTTWTSLANSRVWCNQTTLVGVTYAHGPVTVGCNTGGFWQSNTDNVLRITGLTISAPTGLISVDPATHQAVIPVSANLSYAGSGDVSGINITFTADDYTVDATTDAEGSVSALISLPPGVYSLEAEIGACECCNFRNADLLVVYDPTGGFVTGGGWIDSPAGAVAPVETDVYFNGFETDINGWFTPTRVTSGNNGVSSAAGSYHAEATDDFTTWGGYNSVFPVGGFITSIDIYLNMDGGYTNDTRSDWSSAIFAPDGNHRRDFIFNGGFYNDATEPGAGQNRFVFSASNNAPGWPKNPGRDPIAITTTGWYTLQHRFYDSGAGVLAVDLSILDSSGNPIHTWTLSDPTDIIGTTVGGNGYGWFVTNNFPFLAIDNSVRKEFSNPTGPATFGFVSKYKKGTTVPEGNTAFEFKAGNLNFHSTSYEWLVVNKAGMNAQFKGYGTINGAGSYGFMLWASDGSPDTFRIKIWDAATEVVVYDNGTAQPIGGGSIVVHTK